MQPLVRVLVRVSLLASAAPALGAQWSSQQDARIAPSPNDLSTTDEFGKALDIDGVTLVVGAHWHDPAGGAPNDGGAWIWTRGASGWVQDVKLAPTVLSGGRFGFAVAASGDTVAIGAPHETFNSATAAGAVYVYTRGAGGWGLEARLVAADFGAVDHFGWSLALDGDTLAIGAANDDAPGASDRGSAYVFTRANGGWTQQAKLLASDGVAFDVFGSSIALDGERLVVGAPRADVSGASNRGAAYVFERSGSTWSEVAKLAPPDGAANDQFGFAVALDADTAAVGAPFHDSVGSNAGAAYVFAHVAGSWAAPQKLTDIGFVFADNFGTALALEGDRLAVGLPINNVPGVTSGAVQFYTRAGAVWTGHFDIIGSDTDGLDYLGSSVAISGDFIAAGAPGAESVPGGLSVGEAYVFKITAPPLIETYCTAKVNSLGCTPTMGWSGTPSATNPSAFTVRCTQVLNAKYGLLFYGYAPTAAAFQGGLLCVAPPLRRTPLQHSGGSPAPLADCTGVYVFDVNAVIQGGGDPNLISGAHAWCQYWMRDPQSPSTTGLSNGVHFQIDP